MIVAPKGTPSRSSPAERPHQSGAESPELIQRFKQDDLDIIGRDGGGYDYVPRSVKKWGRVVKERGMRAE